jgi:hypothetical protein
MEYEDRAFVELPMMEEKAVEIMEAEGGEDPMEFREFLTRYTNGFARATMQRWWEMGTRFWEHFARGW